MKVNKKRYVFIDVAKTLGFFALGHELKDSDVRYIIYSFHR